MIFSLLKKYLSKLWKPKLSNRDKYEMIYYDLENEIAILLNKIKLICIKDNNEF